MQQPHDELLTHLITTLSPAQMAQLQPHRAELIQPAAQEVAEDLIAYAWRDPASRGRGELILESYASFKAVLYYRLAHCVWNLPDPAHGQFCAIALTLSNQGKLLSGAEIHPAARIGRAFCWIIELWHCNRRNRESNDSTSCVRDPGRRASPKPDGKRHPALATTWKSARGQGARVCADRDNFVLSAPPFITQDVTAGTKVKVVNNPVQKNDESTPATTSEPLPSTAPACGR